MSMYKSGIWHILYCSKHQELSDKQVFQVLTCLVSTCILIPCVKAGRKSKQVLEKRRHLASSEHTNSKIQASLCLTLLSFWMTAVNFLHLSQTTTRVWHGDQTQKKTGNCNMSRGRKNWCVRAIVFFFFFFLPRRCYDASASAVSSFMVPHNCYFTSTESYPYIGPKVRLKARLDSESYSLKTCRSTQVCVRDSGNSLCVFFTSHLCGGCKGALKCNYFNAHDSRVCMWSSPNLAWWLGSHSLAWHRIERSTTRGWLRKCC